VAKAYPASGLLFVETRNSVECVVSSRRYET